MPFKNPGHHIEKKNIPEKKKKKKEKSFRYSNQKFDFETKESNHHTRSKSLNKQSSTKSRSQHTTPGIFLRNSGKTQSVALLIHKKERPEKKAFCSNKLKLKLHTACDFLSAKSRHVFKFEAFFMLCMHKVQTLHAMLMIQLSLFWAVWLFSPGLQFFGEVTQYPTNWRFNS